MTNNTTKSLDQVPRFYPEASYVAYLSAFELKCTNLLLTRSNLFFEEQNCQILGYVGQ